MTREHGSEPGGETSRVRYSPTSGVRTIEIVQPGALLSKKGILRHLEAGNIVIHPLIEENIGGASVDVTLGGYFWRERKSDPENELDGYINLWDEGASEQMWIGPFKAMTAEDFVVDVLRVDEQCFFNSVHNIKPDDQVIPLKPGENILGHTEEFIGGNLKITTSMQARSSLGRSGVTVCRCAGWGDPGYINRWTMEITNNSREHPVILVVGRRVAQIVFWEVEPVGDSYSVRGKYQRETDLESLKRLGKPEDMLPRLYLDREVDEIAGRVAEEAGRREFYKPKPGVQYAVPPTFLGVDESHNYYVHIAAEIARRQYVGYGLTPDDRQHFKPDEFGSLVYGPSAVEATL